MVHYKPEAHRIACCRFPRLGRAGAIGVVTAVCGPLLLMIVGFAADYGYASYINQCLARAADDAAVGAVSQTAATAVGGYSQLAGLTDFGNRYFKANTDALGLSNVSFTMSVVADGSGGVIATDTYSYDAPASFGAFIGISKIPLSGGATTTARPLTYINFYILVDVSESMGIGATQADMAALYQRVVQTNNADPTRDKGCVFGCHVKQYLPGLGRYQQYTNEYLAHSYGSPLTLRIDSAISAIQSMVGSASQVAGSNKNIQFGIYAIGYDTTTNNNVNFLLDPPSNAYSTVQSTASNIDLVDSFTNRNTGDTDFHSEFQTFLSGLKDSSGKQATMQQGSGASATSPLNYVILITDGLVDVNGNCTMYGICTSPIDPNDCDTLKANATVGVIYTTYIPIYQFNTAPTLETRYSNLVDGKPPLIRSALQSCATSADWFFEAQDGPAITSSMQALFQRTQPVSARISQ